MATNAPTDDDDDDRDPELDNAPDLGNVVPMSADAQKELDEAMANLAQFRKDSQNPPRKNPGVPGRPKGAAKINTPLAYMISVINNPKASPERRDKMAIAAAKYLHRQPGQGGPLGKKEQKQNEAADLTKSGSKFKPAQPPRLVK